jgi:hypothetical protein
MRRATFFIILIVILIIAYMVVPTGSNPQERPRAQTPAAEIANDAATPDVMVEDVKVDTTPVVKFAPSVGGESSEKMVEAEVSAPAMTSEENDYIRLFTPAVNATVPSPFEVTGEARGITGNTLYVRIRNTAGAALIEETARVFADGDAFGPFRIALSYQFRHGEDKVLDVYAKDASGVEQYMISVPLRFEVTE